MPKRLSVLMTVFNEIDFVEYAIRSCLPYVDDLVIVEGSYKETIACGAEPRSTDGTREKILSLITGDDKVTYFEQNAESDKDQRNIGLNAIKEFNPDGWLHIVDGDEVYTKENFEMIHNFMNLMEKQNKRAAYFKSLTFVNDMQNFTEQEFPRLFRITKDCTFVNDNHMTWRDADWTPQYVIKLPYLRYHHFAFCKSDQSRFKLKCDWWNTRFGEKEFEYDWYQDEEGKIWSPNHTIQKYTGKLPKIMKDHPMYPKEKEFKNDSEKMYHTLTGKTNA